MLKFVLHIFNTENNFIYHINDKGVVYFLVGLIVIESMAIGYLSYKFFNGGKRLILTLLLKFLCTVLSSLSS